MNLIVLYASETGNAEEVAYEIYHKLDGLFGVSSPSTISIESMSTYDISNLPTEKLIIFVVSTTGDGDPPEMMKKFWSFLLRRSLARDSLTGLRFGVFGLGDSSYEQFNAVARKLDKRLKQLGAEEVVSLGLGDDQAVYGYFTALNDWLKKLQISIADSMNRLTQHQPPSVLGSIPPSESIQQYKVVISPPTPTMTYDEVSIPNDTQGEVFQSTVEFNNRLTDGRWGQDVRHLRLSFSVDPSRDLGNGGGGGGGGGGTTGTGSEMLSASYVVGDIVEVFYRNSKELVDLALSLITLDNNADTGDSDAMQDTIEPVATTTTTTTTTTSSAADSDDTAATSTALTEHSLLTITPASTNATNNDHTVKRHHHHRASRISTVEQCSLRQLLTCYLDIGAVPKRSYFAALACYASDPLEVEKLLELSSDEGTDLYFDYCLRERKNYIEVLEEFRSVTIPPVPVLCALIPRIPPRQYSIASAPVTNSTRINSSTIATPTCDANAVQQVDLCVAVEHRRTPYGRTRTGLCSGFISKLSAGDKVFIRLKEGTIRSTPIVQQHYFPQCASVNSSSSVMDAMLQLPPVPSPLPTASSNNIALQPSAITLPSSSLTTAATVPLILVGPGTGVAPMRALIQQHYQQHYLCQRNQTHQQPPQQQLGDILLFFGCRKKARDYLFSEEWETINNKEMHSDDGGDGSKNTSKVTVKVAFSQDQDKKDYVTHRIRENGGLVCRMLLSQGACVFVSGAAKRMPADVKKAFSSALQTHAEMSESDSEVFLASLVRQKKYIVEAWS